MKTKAKMFIKKADMFENMQLNKKNNVPNIRLTILFRNSIMNVS